MAICSFSGCVNEGTHAIIVNGPPVGKPSLYIAYRIELDGTWCDEHIDQVHVGEDVMTPEFYDLAMRDIPQGEEPDFSRPRIFRVRLDDPDYVNLNREKVADERT